MNALGNASSQLDAPTVFGKIGDVAWLCRATDASAMQLAAIKISSVAAGAICVVSATESLLIAPGAALAWSGAGFVLVTFGRLLHSKLANARLHTIPPELRRIWRATLDHRVRLFWRPPGSTNAAQFLTGGPTVLQTTKGRLALRPDAFGRWAGQWGCYTRSVPDLVFAVQYAPVGRAPGLEPRPAALDTDSRRRRLEAHDGARGENPTSRQLLLGGRIFGENRGGRTLRQLHRRNELSDWMCLPLADARALADEAWGSDPGIPRDRKLRLAYLAAVDLIAERGLDIRLLSVTSAVRVALRRARCGAVGLAGGESGTWIPDMVKGKLQAFERELTDARRRLVRS